MTFTDSRSSNGGAPCESCKSFLFSAFIYSRHARSHTYVHITDSIHFARRQIQMHSRDGFSKRQRMARYVRLVWFDLLFVTLTCILAYIISFGKPFRMYSRVFPMWLNNSTGLWEGELRYSYPHIPYVLGILTSGLLIGTVPIATVILMQIWVRNLLDLNAAIWGLLKALTLMFVLRYSVDYPTMDLIDRSMNTYTNNLRILFQFILKQYIGGFRPYFMTLCNPNPKNLTRYLERIRSSSTTTFKPSKYTPTEQMVIYNRVFATPADCQTIGNQGALVHAMQSFPSGHSGMAFAVGVFLSLYLNAKLKSFADYHTSFWKVLVVLIPLLGAMLVAGGLMVDKVS